MARELAVDDFETGLMPDAKRLRVQSLGKTRRVAMVGDGIDDAPALVVAAVGVAMGSDAEAAGDGAGVVVLGNDLLEHLLEHPAGWRDALTASFFRMSSDGQSSMVWASRWPRLAS